MATALHYKSHPLKNNIYIQINYILSLLGDLRLKTHVLATQKTMGKRVNGMIQPITTVEKVLQMYILLVLTTNKFLKHRN